MTEQPDQRQPLNIEGEGKVPVGPGEETPATSFDPTRLDFGHHAGRTIGELAEIDPDYLRWLERHPSGVRFRAEVRRVLGVARSSVDWER